MWVAVDDGDALADGDETLADCAALGDGVTVAVATAWGVGVAASRQRQSDCQRQGDRRGQSDGGGQRPRDRQRQAHPGPRSRRPHVDPLVVWRAGAPASGQVRNMVSRKTRSSRARTACLSSAGM